MREKITKGFPDRSDDGVIHKTIGGNKELYVTILGKHAKRPEENLAVIELAVKR
jgi:hypothetical protein